MLCLTVYSDYYITHVHWRDNVHLLVTWSTRLQNRTLVTICHALSTDCHLVSVARCLSASDCFLLSAFLSV